jgi:hypothetical protein
MSTVLEYTYDDANPLDDKEAVERYRTEKSAHPDAMVIIDDLGCGSHWQVKTYKTKEEKESYLIKRIDRILERFTSAIRK